MAYTPREAEDEATATEDIEHPSYSIFKYETDTSGLSLLNFSSGRRKKCFPDYTAEKKYADGEKELWEVRDGAGMIEAEINTGHVSKMNWLTSCRTCTRH